jgi:hypothetical protein
MTNEQAIEIQTEGESAARSDFRNNTLSKYSYFGACAISDVPNDTFGYNFSIGYRRAYRALLDAKFRQQLAEYRASVNDEFVAVL